MELIMCGNPNLNTVRNVIYFANSYFGEEKINKVFFIDTDDSNCDDQGESLEGERNAIAKHYLGNKITISSQEISKQDLHIKIPEIISKEMLHYSVEDLIIDMTNGKRIMSSILYAAASLSKLNNLFFLFVKHGKLKCSPEDLESDDYEIEVISPIKNIETIGKHTFFEIIYYKDKELEIRENLDVGQFRSSYLKSKFCNDFSVAIQDYFSANYPNCIINTGQLAEEISKELYYIIKNKAKGKLKSIKSHNFPDYITWLQANFCEVIRGKMSRNDELEDYEKHLVILVNADKLLDIIRVYRNRSAHPGNLHRGQEEARLVLNTFIYLMKQVIETGVLK